MISHEHRCVFIHIPKCAGTSIEAALGHFSGEELRRRQDHRSVRMLQSPIPWRRALGSAEGRCELLRRARHRTRRHAHAPNRRVLSPHQYRSYFKFSFVRNPWARAYSWFKNVRSDPRQQENLDVPADIDFDTFLRRFAGRGMLKPQAYWLVDFSGAVPLDFLGRFESLATDFAQVCEQLGIAEPKLPHKVRSAGRDEYLRWYTPPLKRLVEEVYADDIARFGYRFDG